MVFMKMLTVIVLAMILVSCQSTRPPVKKRSSLTALWLPFAPARVQQVYNHSLLKSPRYSSDCGYGCPDVDVWQFQYRDPATNEVITSPKPISIVKKYWKHPDEARVIAISLFDGKEFYYNALLQYLESFKNIKRMNNITDKVWGYETFVVRIYVSKRNPKDLARLGEITNRTPDDIITNLLLLGCEIAYVDNKLPEAKKDGTFWRFAAASDEMPEGQRVRYLMRDADNILTAVELYAVADWINSGKRYHRMHIIPVCFGPLTAMLWGGTHTGKGDFSDYHEMVKNYPYRYEYGDDELFTRDLMWPRLKSVGSVLTHHFPRGGFKNKFGTPYRNSCEEPTNEFCRTLNSKSECEDRVLPENKNLQGSVEALGLRMKLEDLVTDHPEFFDLELSSPQRKFIYDAFKGL
jgi:hypothetical protein